MAKTGRFEIRSPTAKKLKVFLCHAREDAALADGIAAGLDYDGGFEVSIDRATDRPHESRRGRLGALIAAADTVVFLLTPTSAASSDCLWELDEAARLSKRILPVLAEPLGGATPPQPVAAIAPVRLDPQEDGTPRSFIAALTLLRGALDADRDWVRMHTRLLARARQWEAANRAENRLLSGHDIFEAEMWLEVRPKDAPAPLEIQRDFIQASIRAETARFLPALARARARSWMAPIGVLALLCVALGAAWLAHRNYQAAQAEAQRAEVAQRAAEQAVEEAVRLTTQDRQVAISAATAEQQRMAAVADAARAEQQRLGAVAEAARVEQRRLEAQAAVVAAEQDRGAATAARAAAEAERTAAQIEESRAFAVASAVFRQKGAPDKAAAMAWLALPHDPALSERPVTAEALGALRQARDQVRLRETLRSNRSWVFAAAFAPDGRTFATAGEDGVTRLWDAASNAEILTLRGHQPGATAYSHSGRAVFASGVASLAYAPDGRIIVTGGADSTARLWNAANGAQLRVLRGHEGPVLDAAFSPDGKTLATAGGDGTARLWSAVDGTLLHVISAHGTLVEGVAFSPDGGTLATCGEDGTARLWNTATGAQIRVLTGHEGTVRSVAFAPDGRILATSGDDGTTRLWSADGAEIRVLRGHLGAVVSVTFSPDGRMLATGGADAVGLLWDAATGAEVGALRGHERTPSGGVSRIAFAPDGNTVLTGGTDGTARLWDVSDSNRRSALPLAEFIAETGESLKQQRPLTKTECVALHVDDRTLCPGDQ